MAPRVPPSNQKNDSESVVWDFTEGSRWSPFCNRVILDVRTFLSAVESDGSTVLYPQDLEMAFEGGEKVWLSAAQYLD